MDLGRLSLQDLKNEINRREKCEKMPKKNIIMLGPPGSGKGTQAIKLLNDFCYCQLSTGDLLRDAVKNKTVAGLKAKDAMDKGQLVTNEIIFEIIENEMKNPSCERGIIFDGFPRTAEQAESLGTFLNNIGRNLDAVFELKVNEEEIIDRAVGRRIHLASGRTYHITKNPPKVENIDDVTGEPLIHRSDDNRETVKSRMDIYNQKTLPVAAYYEKMGLLKKVDSMQSIEKVYGEIKSGLMH